MRGRSKRTKRARLTGIVLQRTGLPRAPQPPFRSTHSDCWRSTCGWSRGWHRGLQSICLPRSLPRSASCSLDFDCTLSRLNYAVTIIMNTLHTVNRSTPRLVSIFAPHVGCFHLAFRVPEQVWRIICPPLAALLPENRKADSEFVRFMHLQSNQSLHPTTIIRLSPMPRAMMEAPPFSCRNFKPPPLICSPARQAKKCWDPKRLLPPSGRLFTRIPQRVQSNGLLVSTSETPRPSRGSHCRQKA